MTRDEQLARLERRIDRERRARQEAEEIAERGMRDLWLANRELESRVAERTAELERSLRAATMADDAKEAFLADLGHDLATPLHAVLGLLELIDQATMSHGDLERLDQAISHARELSDLLLCLVELAGADGAVHPEEIVSARPAEWLDDLTSTWTRRLASTGQLLVPVNQCLASDLVLPWKRLRRIADIFLDNVQAHAVVGAVRVEISGDAESGSFGCAVTDGGPGLDVQHVTAATEPFVRFGETARSGVGLAIAARLARAAGGDIALQSDGRVTTASVTMMPILA